MKVKYLRTVVLSLAISSFSLYVYRGNTVMRSHPLAKTRYVASTPNTTTNISEESVAKSAVVKGQPDAATKEEEREIPLSISKKSNIAQEELKNDDPSQFHMGKIILNLGYLLSKESPFLTQNPELKKLLDMGKGVRPEDINFPEGFHL